MPKVKAKWNFIGTEGFNKIGDVWDVNENRFRDLLRLDLVEEVPVDDKKEAEAKEKKEIVDIKEKVEVTAPKKRNGKQ